MLRNRQTHVSVQALSAMGFFEYLEDNREREFLKILRQRPVESWNKIKDFDQAKSYSRLLHIICKNRIQFLAAEHSEVLRNVRCCLERLSTFNGRSSTDARSLSNALWAVAKLVGLGFIHFDDVQDFCTSYFHTIVSIRQQAKPQSLSISLWAMARLVKEQAGYVKKVDVKAIVDCFEALAQSSKDANPRDLSNGLSSVVKIVESCGYHLREITPSALTTCFHELICKREKAEMGALSSSLSAVSKVVEACQLDLIKQYKQDVVKCFHAIAKKRRYAVPQDLLYSLWAVVRFVKVHTYYSEKINPKAIADCFRVFAYSNENVNTQDLSNALSAGADLVEIYGQRLNELDQNAVEICFHALARQRQDADSHVLSISLTAIRKFVELRKFVLSEGIKLDIIECFSELATKRDEAKHEELSFALWALAKLVEAGQIEVSNVNRSDILNCFHTLAIKCEEMKLEHLSIALSAITTFVEKDPAYIKEINSQVIVNCFKTLSHSDTDTGRLDLTAILWLGLCLVFDDESLSARLKPHMDGLFDRLCVVLSNSDGGVENKDVLFGFLPHDALTRVMQVSCYNFQCFVDRLGLSNSQQEELQRNIRSKYLLTACNELQRKFLFDMLSHFNQQATFLQVKLHLERGELGTMPCENEDVITIQRGDVVWFKCFDFRVTVNQETYYIRCDSAQGEAESKKFMDAFQIWCLERVYGQGAFHVYPLSQANPHFAGRSDGEVHDYANSADPRLRKRAALNNMSTLKHNKRSCHSQVRGLQALLDDMDKARNNQLDLSYKSVDSSHNERRHAQPADVSILNGHHCTMFTSRPPPPLVKSSLLNRSPG